MDTFYHPDNRIMREAFGEDFEEGDQWTDIQCSWCSKQKNHDFHLKDVDSKLICRCGCKEFEVGEGSFYTAIKCIKCGAELMIHEG